MLREKKIERKKGEVILNNSEKQTDLPSCMSVAQYDTAVRARFWEGEIQCLIGEPILLPISFVWLKMSLPSFLSQVLDPAHLECSVSIQARDSILLTRMSFSKWIFIATVT